MSNLRPEPQLGHVAARRGELRAVPGLAGPGAAGVGRLEASYGVTDVPRPRLAPRGPGPRPPPSRARPPAPAGAAARLCRTPRAGCPGRGAGRCAAASVVSAPSPPSAPVAAEAAAARRRRGKRRWRRPSRPRAFRWLCVTVDIG
ncbi:Protein of unknown function [Gryllus bimaculatus]|nr:Protein of unknown function [Gryllus bimaculatus]